LINIPSIVLLQPGYARKKIPRIPALKTVRIIMIAIEIEITIEILLIPFELSLGKILK
jgi:hypothetical protein